MRTGKIRNIISKNKKFVLMLCALSSIMLIILSPAIIAAFYSCFQADDFSHANAVGVFLSRGGSYLSYLLHR